MNLTSIKPSRPFVNVEDAKRKMCPSKSFDKKHAPCPLCEGIGYNKEDRCPNCSNGKIDVSLFVRDYYNPIMEAYENKFAQWREENDLFRKIWAKLNKEERNVIIKLIKL